MIFLLLNITLLAKDENFHLFTVENMRYDYTATSKALSDARLSYDLPGASYLMMNKDYILLASVKYSKKQDLGATSLGSTQIQLEQFGWKYEFGAGYKYYLTDKFYVGPALLFSDSYSKIYQTTAVGTTVTQKHDNDLRLYAIFGYAFTKSTLLFGAVELDNDLLESDYTNDYSQYQATMTLYQFLSKDFFLFVKYEQSLRNKDATPTSAGNRDYRGYGFGIWFENIVTSL